MATIGNNDSDYNTNRERAFVRNTFFDSKGEREELVNILLDPTEKQKEMMTTIDAFCGGNAQTYFDVATHYINQVEQGKYGEEKMGNIEDIIAYCLSKIEDIHPEQTHEFAVEPGIESGIQQQNGLQYNLLGKQFTADQGMQL